MNINFPEQITNIIKLLAEKRGLDQSNSSYYQILILSIATLKYILDNINEDKVVCLYDKNTREIEEIEV